jgi:putative membrane protein
MATLTIRQDQEKAAGRLTVVLSFAIPLAVMALLGLPKKLPLGEWTRVLPHVIAVINTLTSIAIVTGIVAIKSKRIALHRASMQAAFGLGTTFLVAYVLYHLTNESTKYGGVGAIRSVYFFVLFSHIFLSIGVVPLVLRAMFFALSNQVARHRAVVRWAAPLWLYVSVTGVIAYAMIRPFYR